MVKGLKGEVEAPTVSSESFPSVGPIPGEKLHFLLNDLKSRSISVSFLFLIGIAH